jgi:hypothetical protein
MGEFNLIVGWADEGSPSFAIDGLRTSAHLTSWERVMLESKLMSFDSKIEYFYSLWSLGMRKKAVGGVAV